MRSTWMRRIGIVVLIGGMCIGDYCLGVTQAIAARPVDTVTNIRVVDSSPTPVTVGEVVGATILADGSAVISLLLNPALTDQKLSPLVQANGQWILGTAAVVQLFFTGAACSGTAIFQWTDANGELFLGKHITAPTFIVPLTSSSFKLYIADMGATPTVFPVMSYQ